MSEPVITREAIVQQVQHAMGMGTQGINPYPPGSDAAAAWDATVARLTHATVDEGEASA